MTFNNNLSQMHLNSTKVKFDSAKKSTASKLGILFALLLLFVCSINGFSQAAGALNFDGTNDEVVVNSPFYTFTNQITVEWWVNATTITSGSGIGQATNGIDNMATNVWLMHLNPGGSGSVTFFVNDAGSWISTTGTFPSSGWHHVAGVASTLGIYIYIDGVLASSASGLTGTIRNNSSSVIAMGRDVRFAAGRFMAGDIDEVRIWSRALCATEIAAHMSCQLTGTQTGLQEYYQFNQGTIGANNSAVTTLNDGSGNAHHGVLNNFGLTGASSNWVAGNVTGTCSAFSTNVVASPSVAICTTNSTTLSAVNGTTYTWSPATGLSATTGSSVTATPVSTTTYTVTGINAGCANTTSTVSVTVNATPATITGNLTTSTAVPTTLSNININGVWSSVSTGVATINSTTGVVTGVSVGTSVISYTLGPSCSAATTVNVNAPRTGLKFDGVDDYVILPATLNGNFAGNQITLEGWYYFTPTVTVSGMQLIGQQLTTGNVKFSIWMNDSTVFAGIYPGGWITASSVIHTSQWTHVAATYDGTDIRLYINGILMSTMNYGGALPAVTLPWYLGKRWDGAVPDNSKVFTGIMDEVRVWTVART